MDDYAAAMNGNVRGMKIGLPKEYFKGLASETGDLIQKGIDALQKLGCEMREVSLPTTDYAIACYYIICTAEASSNLARYDGVRYTKRVERRFADRDVRATRGEGFGAECKRRIMLGTYVLSAGYYDAYYLKAQKVRALILKDFTEAFQGSGCSGHSCVSVPGLQTRREAAGSDGDVPVRYLHDYRRSGRNTVYERAVRNDSRPGSR